MDKSQQKNGREDPALELENLVTERVDMLTYIRKIHSTGPTSAPVYWMNCVRINHDQIRQFHHKGTQKKRLEQWMYLGLSIAPLLQLNNGWWFLRGVLQLLEEYEYHFSNVAVQGMKILQALTMGQSYTQKQDAMGVLPSGRSIAPTINRVSEDTVVYKFLRTPTIPCELDYCQVIFSLCDILTFVYRKILSEREILLNSPTISNTEVDDSIRKIDSKLHVHFFELVVGDINTLAQHLIKQEVSKLDNILNIHYDD